MYHDKISQIEGEVGYRAMFQYATVGILVVDSEGHIVLANPFIERHFGYLSAELMGQKVELLIPATLREGHAGHREQYFSHPRNRPMGRSQELHARRKDGTEFPVEISLGHYELDGNPLAVAFITDITLRRRAEEQARLTEQEYRAIFEGIHESFMLQQIVKGDDGRIVDLLFLDVNRKAEDLVGRDRAAIIGHLRSEFFGPLDDELVNALQRVGKGELVRHEQYFQQLDRWFDRRFYLHKPGQLVALSIDITQQKKNETFLKESRAALEIETSALSFLNEVGTRLGRVIDLQEGLEQILSDAIALTGAQMGNVQLFDAEKRALSIAAQKGFSEECLSFFSAVSAGDRSGCGTALLERKQAVIENIEENAPSTEYREMAIKSGFRTVQSTPLLAQDGSPLGMISTHFKDVHKFGPHELEKMSLLAQKAESFVERCAMVRDLEDKISERTQALAQALEQQKELSNLKSRFLSIASHEFRTPLSTILSSASLIELYNQPEQQANRKKHIARIKLAVKNLNDILGEFLSLEKLEQGRVEVVPEPLDFREMCADIVEEITGISKAGQVIHLKYDCRPVIHQDKKILRGVLLNLLSNAVKYSGEDKNIKLSVTEEDNKLLISVRDEGIGIPENEQQYLFGNFFRAKNAAGISGTGLGLNIVKRYVELMSGKISFVSKLDQGTTFFVQLPSNTNDTTGRIHDE